MLASWLDFNKRATELVSRNMVLDLYKLSFVEERVLPIGQIASIDAIWLHVGMLAFTCHKAMSLRKLGREFCTR